MKCEVYYCETHSPWQRVSNENMNGRLRKYLPKNAKINFITQDDLDLLAAKMNRCPRKCIGYKTPNELFIQQYKNDCRSWSSNSPLGKLHNILILLVGVTRIELATPASRRQCSTRLSYTPCWRR